MERIGKYEIIRRLGEGSSSTVWLCRDSFAARQVAVKVTKAEVLRDPRHSHVYRKLFLAEAALAGKLNHPHIASIYDAVDAGDMQYLVIEYVQGDTLERFSRPDRLLPVAQVLEIVFKCSRALAYAHQMGITHRDIKPANILAVVSASAVQEVKLTDFGTAFDHRADTTLVAGIGSPAYMAPEQIADGSVADQTDLYSLGVVMYQLLTGHLPYEAKNNASLLYQVLHVEPTRPSMHRKGLPSEVERVVLKALAKRPENRYASWDEFAADLAQLARSPETAPVSSLADAVRFELLRQLRFFRDFTDAQLWEVVRFGDWQRIDNGTRIFTEGEIGTDFYLVAEGHLSVTRSGRLLSHIGPGECIGEMAFLDQLDNPQTYSTSTRSADVNTDSVCTLIRISRPNLKAASEGCQLNMERALLRLLVQRLRAANQRIPH